MNFWRIFIIVLGTSLLGITGLISVARRNDPQPTWIVFSSNRSGDDEIYRMRPDGSHLERMTFSAQPDWVSDISPDGGRILFGSYRDGDRELYQMNLDGTEVERLTVHQGVDDWGLYSPDGQQVVYVAEDGISNGLFVLDLSTRQITRLGQVMEVGMASWSPDGEQIAFAGWLEDGYFKLFSLPLPDHPTQWNRLRPVPLTTGDYQQFNPVWSPDGEWIAYYANPQSNWDVYLIRPDGIGRRRLTTSADFDGLPRWSPDGQYLVFVSWKDGNQEIYTMHRSGSDQTRLTYHPNDDTLPIWSPVLQLAWHYPRELGAIGAGLMAFGGVVGGLYRWLKYAGSKKN